MSSLPTVSGRVTSKESVNLRYEHIIPDRPSHVLSLLHQIVNDRGN